MNDKKTPSLIKSCLTDWLSSKGYQVQSIEEILDNSYLVSIKGDDIAVKLVCKVRYLNAETILYSAFSLIELYHLIKKNFLAIKTYTIFDKDYPFIIVRRKCLNYGQ